MTSDFEEGAQASWGKTYGSRDARLLQALDAAPLAFYLGLAAGLVSARFPMAGGAWYDHARIHVHGRARVGDTVTVHGTITNLRPAQATAVLRLTFQDQRGESLARGELVIRLPALPPPFVRLGS